MSGSLFAADFSNDCLPERAACFLADNVFRTVVKTLTGSATIAVLVQGILSGISHSYQGIKSVIVISVYGVMFGLLAHLRGSLRPGMIAHAWTDIASGLLK